MADELLERHQCDRDRRSYERLVETHRPLVASVCRRFLREPDDVDDVVQETFLKLGRHIGLLSGSIEMWLTAAAQSSSVDFIRRAVRERNRRRGLAEMNGGRARAGAVEALATREAIRLRLHEAMIAMEPAAREVLAERFFRRTPLRVLAARLNVSVPTASRRVTAALRQLAHVLRDMGVPAAHERDLPEQFGDRAAAAAAACDADAAENPDHGSLRFAPDWRAAELTPLGSSWPTTTLMPGWSRPLRVGALVSYESTRVIGANGRPMSMWQQIHSTTLLPPAGLQLVAVVEPGTVHRGIVESTLRDHSLIGGLIEADDEGALETLDVLIVGINWAMTGPIARAIARAVRGGMGLLNEYWTGNGIGACDDVSMRELMLADSVMFSYHMPGRCGLSLPASVLREHSLLPGLERGAKITVSGCGPAYRVVPGAQVLVAKDYLVQPREHGGDGLGPLPMPCYIVGQLGRGRVIVNHAWALPGMGCGACEIIRHLNVSHEQYFLTLLRWLAAGRADHLDNAGRVGERGGDAAGA